MNKLANLLNVKALSKSEQKSISGGNAPKVACYCNGAYTGDGGSSNDCARLCYQCVTSGGCQ